MSNWLAYGKYDRVIEEHQKIIDEGIYSHDVFIGLCYICAKHKLSQVSMLETANIDLSQDEIIQIILKNNKNHNDLKMLDDLLDKNKKNREERNISCLGFFEYVKKHKTCYTNINELVIKLSVFSAKDISSSPRSVAAAPPPI